MIEYIVFIFFFIGLFFSLLGSIALLRFPDVYTRLHGATKCTTFGSIFMIGAAIVYGLDRWYIAGMEDMGILALHAAIALIALLLTNPVGAHAIARAAHRSGVEPVKAEIDELAVEKEKCGCTDIKGEVKA